MEVKLSEFKGLQPRELALSHYTPDLGALVCELIASGLTMKRVAEAIGTNSQSIYKWAVNHKGFSDQMIAARAHQAHVLMDRAYEELEDHIARGEAKDGRQAVEGYVKIAEKLHPLKYGIRHVEYRGEIENKMSEDERNLRILELLARTNPELLIGHVPETIDITEESNRLLEDSKSRSSEEPSEQSEAEPSDYSEAS